jgi:hypothetical protein
MPRQLESWGGEVHLPHWLHRLLRRPEPEDSPERARERRNEAYQPVQPDRTPVENVDRAILGGLSPWHPANQEPRRGD